MSEPFHDIAVNSFGAIIYPRGATLGPRVNDQYELVWVQSEHFDVVIDGTSISVKGSDLLFIHPGQKNFITFSSNAPTRHGYLNFRFSDRRRPSQLSAFPNKLIAAGTGVYLPIFDRLVNSLPALEECDDRDTLLLAKTTSLFLESYGWSGLSHPDAKALKSAPLARARQALENFWRKGYEKQVSVAELAEVAGVTPRQLNRLFHSRYALSTSDYIKKRRLAHSAKLLERSNLTIQEISRACGFESPFAFSRAFKKEYRLAPSYFRESKIERLQTSKPQMSD